MKLFFRRIWPLASLYSETWLRHVLVWHHVGILYSMTSLEIMLLLVLLTKVHRHAVHSCWHRHSVMGEVLRLHYLHVGLP